ncbi:MAG: hypothetical protein FWC51_01615 [Proteobacteria bacterium]|nr:hypothetical protein [Pseudomonadota bacterium]
MGQLVSDVTGVLNQNNQNKQIKQERQQVLTQMASDETTKTNLVKKALAKQRAIYGASGMSGTGMTEEAVLNRLRDETAQPYDDKKLTNLAKLSKLKTSNSGTTNILKSILNGFSQLMA